MRRDLRKGRIDSRICPEEVQEEARVQGVRGLADLGRRLWPDFVRDAALDRESRLDWCRLWLMVEDAYLNAWIDFWLKEDVDVIKERASPGMSYSEWLAAVFAPLTGPEGEGRVVGGPWRAVMTDSVVRSIEQIAKSRKHLSDEEAEHVVYEEVKRSFDRAYTVLMDRLCEELNPEARRVAQTVWGKDEFRRGVTALLVNNLNAEALTLLHTVILSKENLGEDALWPAVAEKLGLPVQAADALKQRYHRVMQRVTKWIPQLAQYYTANPEGFDPIEAAKRLASNEDDHPV